jgi:hypothetical protein
VSELEDAAEIMEEATSGFVVSSYGLEGLQALVAAGWTISGPSEASKEAL